MATKVLISSQSCTLYRFLRRVYASNYLVGQQRMVLAAIEPAYLLLSIHPPIFINSSAAIFSSDPAISNFSLTGISFGWPYYFFVSHTGISFCSFPAATCPDNSNLSIATDSHCLIVERGKLLGVAASRLFE